MWPLRPLLLLSLKTVRNNSLLHSHTQELPSCILIHRSMWCSLKYYTNHTCQVSLEQMQKWSYCFSGCIILVPLTCPVSLDVAGSLFCPPTFGTFAHAVPSAVFHLLLPNLPFEIESFWCVKGTYFTDVPSLFPPPCGLETLWGLLTACVPYQTDCLFVHLSQ